jgi:hypothetical protein
LIYLRTNVLNRQLIHAGTTKVGLESLEMNEDIVCAASPLAGRATIISCQGHRLAGGMRWIVALIMIAFASGVPARAQVNYDRPGGDYTHLNLRPADPAVCAARCERDGRCRAWAFRYPTADNPNGVCWLKNSVPQRKEDSCCASGVRGAGVIEPRGEAVEFSIDRYGGDYRHFELPADSTGKSCQAACTADNKCRAWTYVRPGYGTPAARCFLKSQIKPPRRRPYAISGVVR